MLSNTSHHWPEGLLKLPVNSIIKHVQEYNGLIPDSNITVSLKLDKKFLNPIEAIFVICNLGYKESSLDFLKILHLFRCLSLSKLLCVFVIHLLVEWKLLDIYNDFGKSGTQSDQSLHEWVLSGEKV